MYTIHYIHRDKHNWFANGDTAVQDTYKEVSELKKKAAMAVSYELDHIRRQHLNQLISDARTK